MFFANNKQGPGMSLFLKMIGEIRVYILIYYHFEPFYFIISLLFKKIKENKG